MVNTKEILLCAWVSMLVYIGGKNFKDFKLLSTFEDKKTDTQGLFGVGFKNSFVIGFRGSEETGISDWITDIKFIPANYPYAVPKSSTIQVHSGFIEAYKGVRDKVQHAVKATSQKRVICTGHSLGGALATLCALDIACHVADKKVLCYTYGSPKVGNPDFIKLYNKKVPQTVRVVNGPDIVPAFPPDIPFLADYEHVGKIHHIGVTSASQMSLDVVKAHLPKNYIKVLEAA